MESKVCKQIHTKDTKGKINGKIIECVRVGKNVKAYITTVLPNQRKGFHYHKNHTMNFVCLKGAGRIVLDFKEEYPVCEATPTQVTIEKDRGILLVNDSPYEMWILSVPTEDYSPEKGDYVYQTLDPDGEETCEA